MFPAHSQLFVALAPVASADETTPPPTTTTPTTGDDHRPGPTDDVAAPGRPRLIPAGVTIGGTLVGGLTGAEARTIVEKRFDEPARRSPSLTIAAHAGRARRGAQVRKAVKTAVHVRRAELRGAAHVEVSNVEARAARPASRKQTDREPVDAELELRNSGPSRRSPRPGAG